jgi:acyl-CoA synthetase (AMP-forming)/AMP-acid ligase II
VAESFRPEDVEKAACSSHPAICSAVAVGILGRDEESLYLGCEVEARRISSQDFVMWRKAVVEAIVRQHGVSPAGVVFVARGSLPRTTSGKLARSAAREWLEEGSHGRSAKDELAGVTAPRVLGGDWPVAATPTGRPS